MGRVTDRRRVLRIRDDGASARLDTLVADEPLEIRPGATAGSARSSGVENLAQRFLGTSERPIEWIASACGVGGQAGLRAHFGRIVGVSPSAYRRTFHERPGAARIAGRSAGQGRSAVIRRHRDRCTGGAP